MAWLRLFRIAALPSALSNILIGYLLAHHTWDLNPLVWLLLSSACIYCAGMVLNDVFDIEVDRQERPSRPIPSGAISLPLARGIGFGLLICGVIVAGLASVTSLITALALATLVCLYDGPLKKTGFGPFAMGACRTLNVLLGASTAASFPAVVVWYAVAIGVFVAGITWLAKREARETQTAATLWPGSILMALGMLLVGLSTSDFLWSENLNPKYARLFPLAIGFLCLPILRRLALAISTASSGAVQQTVITSLRSLIIFDATMGLLIDSGRPVYSICVLSLLAASMLLGKFTRIT